MMIDNLAICKRYTCRLTPRACRDYARLNPDLCKYCGGVEVKREANMDAKGEEKALTTSRFRTGLCVACGREMPIRSRGMCVTCYTKYLRKRKAAALEGAQAEAGSVSPPAAAPAGRTKKEKKPRTVTLVFKGRDRELYEKFSEVAEIDRRSIEDEILTLMDLAVGYRLAVRGGL